eukprot:CAMPEP_0177786792 /NCGR_PEP_ID=MMETSP0491_2-20121128/21119_1 /TAXON_ID=63592 /ORGANISM="Tetraselmis chuii, Strain PLY429" /LENGTH=191 /DNA_ID=CAMNT_0019308041 /DNA_START=108 /DNA_END=683 /DNA_ORIENTATION=+
MAKWIQRGSVKARADEQQLGIKRLKRGDDDSVEHGGVGPDPTPGRQRYVYMEPLPCARAVLRQRAAMVGVQSVLVHRDRQNAVVLVKGLLRAVAVVHIVVDDRDSRQTANLPRVHGRQHNIVEDAEPPAAVPLRVVPGRTAQHVGIVHLPAQHSVYRGYAAAHRQHRNLKAARAKHSTLPRIPSTGVAHLL